MNTERATDFFLERLIAGSCRDSAFVEVGLGSADWSFQWARRLGFPCLAVEPMPIPALLAACQEHGVTLVETALGRNSGTARIYHGELSGHAIPDTSSLRPDWWAVGSRFSEVPVMTLAALVEASRLERIVCLKVDVEGAEWEVLSGLAEVPARSLPEVVAFEYGGGGRRSDGRGGWRPETWVHTVECLELLRVKGYQWGMLCERVLPVPRLFGTQEAAIRAGEIFPARAEVGNVILSRNPQPESLGAWVREFRRLEWRAGIGESFNRTVANARFFWLRYRGAVRRRILGH